MTSKVTDHLRRAHRHNVHTFRSSPLAEISGALGDLGTLLPLMISLAIQGTIKLDSTLVFSGLFNVATGIVFGVPLPVQPMKAIASAAVSGRGDAQLSSVAAAGMLVGASVLLMTGAGAIHRTARRVPVPVVKGIQLGAGLSLVIGAGTSLLQGLSWLRPILDNKLWATAGFVALIATQTRRHFPYALYVFVIAIAISCIRTAASDNDDHRFPRFHFWEPHLVPFRHLLRNAQSIYMAVGQLPLTTLNSIIAVSPLAAELIPDVTAPSVTALGLSVAFMNLTAPWFGCMPLCHGSGGLAAQYRFGARSGASVVMLGLLKMSLGLFFGDTLLDILGHYPKSLLGVMVFAAGLELAKVGQTLNDGASDLWEGEGAEGGHGSNPLRRHKVLSAEARSQRWTVMLTTAGGVLAFRNDALGFVLGMLCHAAYRLEERWQRRLLRRIPGTERAPLLR